MKAVQTGQKIVISLMVISILLSVITTGMTYYLYNQIDQPSDAKQAMFQGITRLVITLLVYHFLYRGHKWAVWVVVILLSLAVFGGVAIAFFVPMSGASLAIYMVPLVFFAGMLYFLLFNGPVKAFLNHQNAAQTPTGA